MRSLWRRLALLLPWRRRAADQDMAEELRALAAMAGPGNLPDLVAAAEGARDAMRFPWIEQTWQDTRHALRGARRAPGFSAAVILTLAVGIGFNVVAFSVVDAALFRPLPYAHADRLVDLYVPARTPDGQTVRVEAGGQRALDDLRAIRHIFDGVEGFSRPRPEPLADQPDVSVLIGGISPGLPDLLGVAPQRGRAFDEQDVQAADRVLISDAYWTAAFGRDPDAVGRTIALADRSVVIVGVMPPTFKHWADTRTDAWLAIDAARANHLVGRLRPGLPLERAQREGLSSALARQVHIYPGDWGRASGPLSAQGRSARVLLFSTLGATACLLLIACANIAGLLLARTSARRHEVIVRAALGASRGRLARQFATEGLVLAALGSLVAITAAKWTMAALPAAVPSRTAQLLFSVGLPALDWRVLLYGAGVAVVTGVLSSVIPALRAAGSVARGDARVGARIVGMARAERRWRDAFQALQVALTVVLLAGAGLLLASVTRLLAVPTGQATHDLMFVQIELPRIPREPAVDRRARFDAIRARLEALPGVDAVTFGPLPIGGNGGEGSLLLPEQPNISSLPAVPFESLFVAHDYLRVVGIPVIEGRALSPADIDAVSPVAVVSDNVAARIWPGQSAVGKRFRLYEHSAPTTIVGVVPRMRTMGTPRDAAVIYIPAADASNAILRVSGDPTPMFAALRPALTAVGPSVKLTRAGRVDALTAELDPASSAEFQAVVFSTFAGIGLLTAAVGLYGLLSYAVSRRTQEIGVRIALGADAGDVRMLVAREVLASVVIGILAGLAMTTWASSYIESHLFNVRPHDPLVLAAVVACLLLVCVAAAIVPARRATRIPPIDALRAE